MKVTYALDAESERTLETVARRWAVSKSEALRRAIAAVAQVSAASTRQPLACLDEVQRALALTPAQAKAWIREIRAARGIADPPRRKKRAS